MILIQFEESMRGLYLRQALNKKCPGRRPAAPGNTSLPLLSFDPGGVRKDPPRRACPDERKHTRIDKRCQLDPIVCIKIRCLTIMNAFGIALLEFADKILRNYIILRGSGCNDPELEDWSLFLRISGFG